jgi:membrane protease YdiL (CAAX protease family)
LVLVVALVVGAVGALIWGDSIGGYVLQGVLATWAVWVIVARKISPLRLLGKIPSGYNWWPILAMSIAGVVYSVGTLPVIWFPLAKQAPELVSQFLTETFAGSRTHFFISAVVVAPLIEETIFRGLLFSRLTVKWGMMRAMVVSSALFGLLHLDPIGAFVFGIVACVLYMHAQTLILPVALHALHNAIVFGLTFVGNGEAPAYSSPEYWGQFLYQGLIAMLVASPVVFMLLGRWWPSRGTLLPYEANRRPGGTPTPSPSAS